MSSLPNRNLVTAFLPVPGAPIALLAAFGRIAGSERRAGVAPATSRATPSP